MLNYIRPLPELPPSRPLSWRPFVLQIWAARDAALIVLAFCLAVAMACSGCGNIEAASPDASGSGGDTVIGTGGLAGTGGSYATGGAAGMTSGAWDGGTCIIVADQNGDGGIVKNDGISWAADAGTLASLSFNGTVQSDSSTSDTIQFTWNFLNTPGTAASAKLDFSSCIDASFFSGVGFVVQGSQSGPCGLEYYVSDGASIANGGATPGQRNTAFFKQLSAGAAGSTDPHHILSISWAASASPNAPANNICQGNVQISEIKFAL